MYKNILNCVCIVRSTDAGVYFGTVTNIEGETVRMENVRNIWYWEGASCLSQIANDGIKDGKVGPMVGSMVLNLCSQIIPMTPGAVENLKNQKEWTYEK